MSSLETKIHLITKEMMNLSQYKDESSFIKTEFETQKHELENMKRTINIKESQYSVLEEKYRYA